MNFRLESDSGLPTYLQLAQQVRQAIRLGALRKDDQLPTVKDVVERLAINPNTVLKAYRELEREGLVGGRPGVGTFVVATLPTPDPRVSARLQAELKGWITKARGVGLDLETMLGMLRDAHADGVAEEIA